MEQTELTGGVWVIRIISWAIWLFLFASILMYFQVPSWGLSTSSVSQKQFFIIVGLLMVWTSLLVGVLFLVRHFGLKRPAMKGSFSSSTIMGIIRLFLISLLFWVLIDILSATGIVLYFLSGKAWPVYFWASIGTGIMCYFAPRLKPFL